MATAIQTKSLDSPDERRSFDQGEAQVVTLGDFTVTRGVLQPGWRWSEHVKPIAQTDSCQVYHTGYVVSGQLKVVAEDGSEAELNAGDVYVVQPGHDAWVVGDEPVVTVDVSSEMAEKYAKEEG